MISQKWCIIQQIKKSILECAIPSGIANRSTGINMQIYRNTQVVGSGLISGSELNLVKFHKKY